MLNVDQNLPIGLSYYVSAGLTDLYSTIGDYNDNQISPMAYYGAYLCSQSKTRFSLNGNYVHSIYNPSFKNDAVIRTSFFEATMGNPEIQTVESVSECGGL